MGLNYQFLGDCVSPLGDGRGERLPTTNRLMKRLNGRMKWNDKRVIDDNQFPFHAMKWHGSDWGSSRATVGSVFTLTVPNSEMAN